MKHIIGRMISATDAHGNVTTYEYDAANRRTAVFDALGHPHRTTYDAAGNMASETDARGHTMSYNYNNLDQRTQITYADASSTGDALDALGRRTRRSDEAAITTDYAYDELGRLTSVTDALGNVTSYTYDEVGNKLTQTDAEGRTTNWAYDALGRISSRTLPLGQSETFTYDATGNRTGHTDFNGNTHAYQFDVNDRLVQADHADGSVTTYNFDAVGNRIQSSITDSRGTRTWFYAYDSMNRLATETKPDGSTLEYGYDAAGNKTQLITTLSGGDTETITYNYDALNRLVSVTNIAGTTTYGYDEIGNRSSISYPNNTSQTWAYDSRNRLTRTSIYNGSGAQIQSFDYTLHPTGRRTQIVELDGRTSSYTYNDLYWLTQETITDAINGDYTARYQYDSVGNRTQGTEAGITTAYRYDDNDRLLQHGGVYYTYDASGNTLTENDEGVISTYGYNSHNQLIEHSALGITTNYQYNPDGIRHSQRDATATTEYLVDANRDYAQVLSERVNGTTHVRYHFGDDLISQSRGADVHCFHADGLGSTRVLTDASGDKTDTYAYSAFGEVLNQDGLTENDYLYTGEQFDETLDQYYLRARYYDQGVGRFTQMDTWSGSSHAPASLNKYLYANANPTNLIDPTGNFSIGSTMRAVGIAANLATAAQVGYSIGDSLGGHYSGNDPISLDKATARNVGMAIVLSHSGGKLAKLLFNKKRYKKLLKKRSLFRGVAEGAPAYEDASRGFVNGSISRIFDPRTFFKSTAEKHNSYLQFNTPFSSWTPKRGIANTFATDGESGKGVVVSAKVETFRIFRSPDRHFGYDSVSKRAHSREFEFLVVGPVQGIPSTVFNK